MNRTIEKIGRRNVIIVVVLVSIVAFSIGYALIQTKTGLAVLTTPPPGISGPYYVTTEAKIYGPLVDLATIKSKMSGTYAPDYIYVQWGDGSLFYRAYVDNTLQQVYQGEMTDVMNRFSYNFYMENDFKATFNNLKSLAAMDPSSELGVTRYFGNMPGVFIAVYKSSSTSWSGTLTTRNSRWYATFAGAGGGSCAIEVRLNDTTCAYAYGGGRVMNASGSSASLYNWSIGGNYQNWAALYFADLQYIETTFGNENLRVYSVLDSPGTSFVSKSVSPSSPVQGQSIDVMVWFDPPTASRMNITEVYPNTFNWGGQQITLEKYKVGTGLTETTSVSAVLTPVGANMQFTIYYYQATEVLEELLADEYVCMKYALDTPDTAGEYTLPASSMSYLIPTIQT